MIRRRRMGEGKGITEGRGGCQSQDRGKAPRTSSAFFATEPSSSGLIAGAHVFVALVF